jgi:penicillin-binding protein 1A
MTQALGAGSGSEPKRPLRRPAWLVGGLLFAAVAIVAGYLAYCLASVPFNGGLAIEPAPAARIYLAANDAPLATRGIFKGEKLPYTEIPRDLVQGLITTEDRRFFEHPGVDWPGVLRALWRDASAEKRAKRAAPLRSSSCA